MQAWYPRMWGSVDCALDLFLPSLPGQKTQIIKTDRRRLAAAGQALEHLWCQIGEAQLAADMALGQTGGLGQFLNRGEFASFHPPPPAPCPANGAQEMGILCAVLARPVIGGRHDLRPPVSLADRQGDQHADCVVVLGHSAASRLRGATISRMTPTMGTRLANSIRSASFPKSGESLNAAALVWSNAPVIIGAHDTGPLIRSKNGFWLAIPTPAAGKSTRGGRITPGEWERRSGLRLRFIYRRRGPSLLVAEGRLNTKGRAVASRSKTGRGVVTVPIFLLVPQVKLPKRLDLARDAERAADGVPGLIVANWVERRI